MLTHKATTYKVVEYIFLLDWKADIRKRKILNSDLRYGVDTADN